MPRHSTMPLPSHISPITTNISHPLTESVITNLKSRIFVKNGQALIFYVGPITRKREISKLIIENGGLLHKTPNNSCYTLVDDSDMAKQVVGNCYSIQFILDSIEEQQLLNLKDYIVCPVLKQKQRTKKRIEYTNQEDYIICVFVKQKEDAYAYNTTHLWKLAESTNLIPKRTWPSMRQRFIKGIIPKLNAYAEEIHGNDGDSDEDLWKELTYQELRDYFNITTADPLTQELFIPPGLFMGTENNFTDPKYITLSVISFLKHETGYPQSVIVHALIVTSGIIKDALEYLKNPKEFCANRDTPNQVWTFEEDRILLESDSEKRTNIELERGKEAVEDRLLFLES